MIKPQETEAIGPIQHTATYKRVVDQIRRVIYLGRYLPGDKLPPERELAQQLGVSRTTLREAIRMLEGENLVRIKRGAAGGILVTAQGVKNGLNRRSISMEKEQELRDIFEYRFAIECSAVRLAAEKRGRRDLAILERLVAEMDVLAAKSGSDDISIAAYNASDTRFHLQIAEATRNPHFARAVEEIRAAMFLPVGSIFERLSEKVNEHHAPILEAIRQRDPDAAEALMRDHIDLSFAGLKHFLGK